MKRDVHNRPLIALLFVALVVLEVQIVGAYLSEGQLSNRSILLALGSPVILGLFFLYSVQNYMTKGIDYSASNDHSHSAKTLFIELLEESHLKYSIGDDEEGFFEITIPEQEGLSVELWVCLQNNDELWLATEDLTFSMFPFPHVKSEYFEALKGFIAGEYRIIRGQLQKPNGDEWITVATNGFPFLRNLLPSRNEVIKNTVARAL